MKIQNALDQFLVQLEADGRSHHTRKQYARHVRLFCSWAHEVGLGGDLANVDEQAVARFFVSDSGKLTATGGKRKATAANAIRSSIRVFFGFCHDAGWVNRNAARLLRRAIAPPPAPRALSEAEEKRFMDVLESSPLRDRVLFTLMLKSGIRLSTALALDIEDLDLDGGMMDVWMKGDRQDRIGFPVLCAGLLRELIGGRDRGPVFLGLGGNRLGSRGAQIRFRRVADAAKLPARVSPHGLRHTFATRLYGSCGDVLKVKHALRHRSIESTMIYTQ